MWSTTPIMSAKSHIVGLTVSRAACFLGCAMYRRMYTLECTPLGVYPGMETQPGLVPGYCRVYSPLNPPVVLWSMWKVECVGSSYDLQNY